VDNGPPDDSLRLPATTAAPRLARRWVVAACAALGDQLSAVAELLTSELVTNAVRHPAADDSGLRVEIVVRLHRSEQMLRVEVHDHDPHPLPAPDRPLPEPRESGMGLKLVAELADLWGTHPAPTGDGKVVWFELQTSVGD